MHIKCTLYPDILSGELTIYLYYETIKLQLQVACRSVMIKSLWLNAHHLGLVSNDWNVLLSFLSVFGSCSVSKES